MNCRRAARLVCFEVGEDLPPRRRSAVADHLAICPACRSFRDELSAILETARSLEVPASERGREELRRRVWTEIRMARHRAETRTAEVRLLIAAAGCSAALLLSLYLLARRPWAESGQIHPHALPPAISSAPVPPDTVWGSAPASPAAPLPRTARAPRPRGDARESGITRIEFRTLNPQVRIIWLVGQEAPETSPALSPSPKQEVS